MKKNYFLSFITLTLFSLSINSQVIIGDGELVNQNIPIEPYFGYSYTQSIYGAGLINTSGSITGIKYFATEGTSLEDSSQWVVYMALTDKNSFEDTSDWIPISEFTTVYAATIEAPTTISEGIVSITFDTPFEYDGISNLVIAVEENQEDYDLSSNDFYCSDYGSSVSIIHYSDSVDADPNDPPTTPGFPNNLVLRQSLPNIVIEGITQSCPTPDVTFTSENINGSSATINWTVDSGEGPYQYAYAESGADADDWGDISGNSTALTGLSPLTDYVFYLRKSCDGEYSAYQSFSFTTDCADLFELPFLEGFNNDNTQGYDATMPVPSLTEVCWEVLDLSPESAPNNMGWTTNVTGNLAFEGDVHARIGTFNNLGKNDDYLISPRLNLSGNDRLKFAAKSWGSGTENNLMGVLLSQTGTEAEDFSIVLQEPMEINGESWMMYSYDLSEYTGPMYIAFHVPPSEIEGYYLMLDAISVEEIPDCDVPLNISVLNESLYGADVVWSAGDSDETVWEYVVQSAELDPPTGQGTVVESTELALDNLESGTDYTLYLRAVCSEGVYSQYTSFGGNFSTVSFGDNCSAPIEIDTLPYNITDDTANYSDYYSDLPGEGCADTQWSYLNGDDVVYSYTATSDTSINVSMSPDDTYAGIFAYDSCENIGVECYAAALNGFEQDDLSFDMNVSANMTYYIVISTWASPQSVGYDLEITENTCTLPTILTSNVDCADGFYSVEFDLSDMGSAELLTFTDDLGNVQYAQETGILTFGPYEGSSNPVVTVVGEDPNCDMTFALSSICNDECDGATPISLGQTITGDTNNATDSGNNFSNDLWYSFTGDGVEEDITVSLCGSSYDTYLRIFDSCTGEQIYFNDDSCGVQSEITFISDGTTTYYIMVEGYSSNNGEFTMNISGMLGVDDNEIENMRIYPNPTVDGFVNIVSSEIGAKFVELFDINGRKVLSTLINDDRLDVSSLESGFYMTQITVNGKTAVIKLIVK